MEISIAHSSSVSSSNATLLVALELPKATWVVALSAPFSDRISHHSIAGGDAGALLKLIGQARSRAEAALGQPVRVVCGSASKLGPRPGAAQIVDFSRK